MGSRVQILSLGKEARVVDHLTNAKSAAGASVGRRHLVDRAKLVLARLRPARALDLLGRYDDLTALSFDLGFSSHNRFSAAFCEVYGRSPSEFSGRRSTADRPVQVPKEFDSDALPRSGLLVVFEIHRTSRESDVMIGRTCAEERAQQLTETEVWRPRRGGAER